MQLLKFIKNPLFLPSLSSVWGVLTNFLISFPVSLDPFILLSDTRARTVPIPCAKWQGSHYTELALGLLCVPCGDYAALIFFFFQLKLSKTRKRAVFKSRDSTYECVLGIAWE